MLDYNEIEEICQANSEATDELIEQQVYYAVAREDLERKLDRQLAKYKKTVKQFHPSTVRRFQMQFFAHQVFKRKGLINKHIKHSFFKDLTELERGFLQHWAEHPWRFSFSVIENQPAEDFYEMLDVFSGDQYLLYSPGLGANLLERNVSLWYILIAFNGSCWQTYGPIGALQSFQPGDIHYYTALLQPNKWPITPEVISVHVEKDPVPYFMLLTAANHPLTIHGEHRIVQQTAEFEFDNFEAHSPEKFFQVENKKSVYRLALKGWSEFPHYAIAYFEETENILRLSALTEIGYRQLIVHLNKLGLDLPDDPDFRVNVSMRQAGRDILNRDFLDNEYEKLFSKEESHAEKQTIAKINRVMDLLVPDINAKRTPNLEEIARKTGVDLMTVSSLANELIKKVRGD